MYFIVAIQGCREKKRKKAFAWEMVDWNFLVEFPKYTMIVRLRYHVTIRSKEGVKSTLGFWIKPRNPRRGREA